MENITAAGNTEVPAYLALQQEGLKVERRLLGRDAGCPTPPSQIPACGITAPGSSGMRAGGMTIIIGTG